MEGLAITDRSPQIEQNGTASEAQDLARLTSQAYARAVAWYREQGLLTEEADALAREPHWNTMEAPSDHVTWSGLNHLQNADPLAMATVWERIKHDAAL